MTLATVSDVKVQIELWQSFLSVFRSYAILDNLMSIPMSGGTPDGGTIQKAFPGFAPGTGRRWELFLAYTPKVNKGHWNICNHARTYSSEEIVAGMNKFSLNPDGTVRLAEADMQMDHAAIEILRFFKDELSRDEIEVPA